MGQRIVVSDFHRQAIWKASAQGLKHRFIMLVTGSENDQDDVLPQQPGQSSFYQIKSFLSRKARDNSDDWGLQSSL